MSAQDLRPDLLAYAQRLGLYQTPAESPPPRAAPRPRAASPRRVPGETGRPRLCSHAEEHRRQRADGRGSYCGLCHAAYNRAWYRAHHPVVLRPKAVCVRGHAIAEVGRHANGRCRACQREDDAAYRRRRRKR